MATTPADEFRPARPFRPHPAEDRLAAVVGLCEVARRLCLDHLDAHREGCRCRYCRGGYGRAVRADIRGLSWVPGHGPGCVESALIGAGVPVERGHADALRDLGGLVERLR